MIAVDTNILVYSHRAESPWFRAANRCMTELAQGPAPWVLPWQCLHEFLSVITNPRIWRTPTPLETALRQVRYWLESPRLVLLSESSLHWDSLLETLSTSGVTGPRVHDARIAALCREHGVSLLWSADRDFSRFRGLNVVNPLVH